MNCPNCGKTNADNFRYCQFCGTALTNSAILKTVSVDEVPPESQISVPGSLDSWLLENDVTSNSVKSSEISGAGEKVDSEDLPLLDENNASLIPVEVSLSGLKVSKGTANGIALNSLDDELPAEKETQHSELSRLIESDAPSVSQKSGRICARCGAIISDGHRFCGNCGTRYEARSDSGTTSSQNAVPQTEPSGMRMSVERMNFVSNHASTSVSSSAVPFTLCHMNDNGSEGEYIPLCLGENIIGRGSTALLSADRFVNPKHIRLICDTDSIILEDFNSLNGVFVRISNDSVPLRNGDIFRIGEELLCYFQGSSAQPLLTNQSSESTELLGGDEVPGWGYLRVVMGAYSEGSVYRLCQPTVSLGRTHANILFSKDGFVSGTHATIKYTSEGAVLTDLDSSNGTFVRIKGPLKISKTTFILIGNQLLRIQPNF